MSEERTTLGIEVECIECGQPVCLHQQAVIRRFESSLASALAELEEARGKLDEVAPWVCEECNRAWPREKLREGVTCVLCPDEACRGFLTTPAVRENEWRKRAERAEAEAARLADENKRLRAFLDAALAPLSEHIDWIEGRGPRFASTHGTSTRDTQYALDLARSALASGGTEG